MTGNTRPKYTGSGIATIMDANYPDAITPIRQTLETVLDSIREALAGEDAYPCHYGETIYYRREEDPATGEPFRPARIEMIFAGGGPTWVLTWDDRGPGWSQLFASWSHPQTIELNGAEYVEVERYINAFIAPIE